MKRAIYLIPFGEVNADILAVIAEAVSQEFTLPCRVGPAMPQPDYAYRAKRGQYLSDLILERLRGVGLPSAHRLLGIVDLDLYTPGLNFIFGQATAGGREALIALARLRQGFYNLPEDETLFRRRCVKEAVHELGHTYSLGHCPDARCVMYFSNTLGDTDRKGAGFCVRCSRKLSGERRP
ncbi:MAG: archaemetzincin family Zn-dependent metalloprotease [Anaerolineae bacterium]